MILEFSENPLYQLSAGVSRVPDPQPEPSNPLLRFRPCYLVSFANPNPRCLPKAAFQIKALPWQAVLITLLRPGVAYMKSIVAFIGDEHESKRQPRSLINP